MAAVYVIYRAHRKEVRAKSDEDQRQLAIDRQDSMILVKGDDGETFLWDGLDLRKRIDFAAMGLELCISREQIETELRRSLFPEMSQKDLNNTIVLNAKTLIERDADFSKFASEILYCEAGSPYPNRPARTAYKKVRVDIWPRVENPWE